MLFNNDNKEIVRSLAKSSLNEDKLNSRFLLLTIIISTFMIMSITLITMGTEQLEKNTQIGKAQVAIPSLSEEKLDTLRNAREVEWFSQSIFVGASYQDDISLNVMYEDINNIEKQKKYPYGGEMPQKENEIAISKRYLNHFGLNTNVGDVISLDLTGTGKISEYIVTAIINDETIKDKEEDQSLYNNNSYTVWVTMDLAKKLWSYEDFFIKVYIRLNTDVIQSHELLDVASDIFEGTNISPDEILLTEYFAVMTGGYDGTAMPYIILFSGITLVLAGIVVYGIFYTSVMKDVRSYGQLRTLGFTKKQVKKMVYKKGTYLAYKGIPMGILLGFILGFALCPKGFLIKNLLISMIYVSIAMISTIRIAIKAPVKLAANISPIEGSRYLSYTGKKNKKKSYKLTPTSLAFMNLMRNKKKTILTILMLGLSTGILIGTSIVAGSIDAEKKARFAYFPDGQIQIVMQRFEQSTFAEREEYRTTRLQLENNPLSDEEFIKRLNKIDGIENITPYNAVYFAITRPTGKYITSTSQDAPTITREEYAKIESWITSGGGYDEMVEKNGILVREDIGDVGEVLLSGRSKNGDPFEITVPVLGTYSTNDIMENNPIIPGGAEFIIAYDTAKKLTGVTDQTGILSINIEENKLAYVTEEMKKLDNELDTINFYTMADRVSSINRMYSRKSNMLYFISGILFIFGIVSLANSVLSNIAVRQKEFGLLQAVGMTNKQIIKMLNVENSIYTIATAFVGIIGGTIYGVINCINMEAVDHCITFRYPWMISLILIVSLCVVQLILALYVKKSLKKYTVIERINIL